MKYIFAFVSLFCAMAGFSQRAESIRYEDKIRIREAMNISQLFAGAIWNKMETIPFVVLLVTDSTEFLIHHPYPSKDFKLLGRDTLLKSDIYYRPRQFDTHLLATFPAVAGVSCIVVGTPENTNKNSTEWIITLLHEHFHQYQHSDPLYYKSVDSLYLSGGDQTGMWMLNYPFPYDSIAITEQYDSYNSALVEAVANINTNEFEQSFRRYKRERDKFKQLLKPADYRYFSFQVWQEGMARYTEYKILELLDDYFPSKEVIELKDFVPFMDYRNSFYQTQLTQLSVLKLKNDKRVCFYAVGFAEGLMLDRLNMFWRDNYLKKKFYIENYSEQYK